MLRLVGRFLRPYAGEVVVNVIFVAAQIVFQTFFLMGEMRNILVNGVNAQNLDVIWASGLHMLLYSAISAVCIVVSSYVSARVVAGFTSDVQAACFRKVEAFSAEDFDRFGASTLLTRCTADALTMQSLLINGLRTTMMVPIIIVCLLVIIFMMSPMLFWVLLGAFVVTVGVLVFFGARSREAFERLQESVDDISELVNEELSGVRAIRAFNNQEFQEAKGKEANTDSAIVAVEANGKIDFLAPASLIIMNWAVIGIYLLGTSQLQAGMAGISDIILIFQYLGYFITSLAVVPFLVSLLPRVAVASRRIGELLDYVPVDERALDPEGARGTGIEGGEVRFDHVSFGYEGAGDVISDVSFVARAHETTAFIGATGSGKTTLMNLLVGLYRNDSGTISIDGADQRSLDPAYLRSRISYGTQKAMVFQDSALANVTAYREVPEGRLTEAVDASQFREVVGLMPEGLDTPMSQGGMNISGGQRQRLSLARTLAKDASIYVFDDTFSALDAQTEARARAAVGEMLAGKTVLMVAQKISTIEHADKIIVLDDGRIAGEGTHDELLRGCPTYQEIYETQNYLSEGESHG